MDIYKALQLSKEISSDIKYLFKSTLYDKFDDLSGLQSNEDTDERFIKTELVGAFEHLEMAMSKINYLNMEIVKTGRLHKNQNGRYELDGKEYSSNCKIEFLYYDDCYEREEWVVSRIEYMNDRYCIVGFSALELDNLLVRERELPSFFE